MTITEITQIGSLILAIVTVTIALRTFKRNKKQELENQLFKIKLEAFSNIAFEFDNFFICLNRGIVKLHDILEKQNEDTSDELKTYSFEIDDQMYKCHTTVVKYSVYFSQESLAALLKFTDNLLGDGQYDGEDSQASNPLQWIDKYYSEQIDISNKAIDKLREELQLEKLHYSLYRRMDR